MHRVLLREIVIDAPAEQFDAVSRFWAGLLGTEAKQVPDFPEFTALPNPAALSWVGLQRINEGPARYHVDVETDDVEAEVARLIRLGAIEKGRHRSWVVLEDPAGLLLCVVPVDSEDFEARSRVVDG
jgi:hypothetical protein